MPIGTVVVIGAAIVTVTAGRIAATDLALGAHSERFDTPAAARDGATPKRHSHGHDGDRQQHSDKGEKGSQRQSCSNSAN